MVGKFIYGPLVIVAVFIMAISTTSGEMVRRQKF